MHTVTLPYLVIVLIRMFIVLVVFGVDVFAPRFNWRIAAVCALAMGSAIAQIAGADPLISACIAIPFWGTLAIVLINKIQRDPVALRELLRDKEREWEAERQQLESQIKGSTRASNPNTR